MKPLDGKIALVTGASRGVGKGIALALGEAGATVYVTGRTTEEGRAAIPLPGTIGATADEVTQAGGVGIAVPCDHRDDEQTRAVFARIERETGHLDVLVNNVWGGYEHFNDGTEFWEETGFWDAPLSRWDSMFAAGVRAHYVCAVCAVPLMLPQKSGLIVTVSFQAAQKTDMGVAYGAAKAADDHMAACMAHELRPHNIAAIALYPGLVRTEAVLKASEFFDLTHSESPQFTGRSIVALAADSHVLSKSGGVFVNADLADEYDFNDIDGTRPTSSRFTKDMEK